MHLSKAQLVEQLEQLRLHENLLAAVEHATHVGHYEWDYETNSLTSCSAEYAAIFNMTIDEALATHTSWEMVLEEIHPDDREHYKNNAVLADDDETIDIEYRIIRNDGQIRHIREFDIIDVKSDGEKRTSFGLLQEITELHSHERDLEHREMLAQQAEAITDIGHFIYDDENDYYLYISPGLARIYGMSSDEYMRKVQSTEDDLDDVHEDDRARLLAVYKKFEVDGKDFVNEYRLFRADGEMRWIRELSTAYLIEDGRVKQSLGVLQDITTQKEIEQQLRDAKANLEVQVAERTQDLAETVEQLQEEIKQRKKMAAELEFLANHDALTGLPSLRLCKDRLDLSLARSRRNNLMSVVMFIDLDGFKQINDRFGHEAGDVVLKATANRIKALVREIDTVARIGGDEFVVILSDVPDNEIVQRVAANVIDQVGQPVRIGQEKVSVGASIGISIYPEDGATSEELIRAADKAMYLVKHAGKNNYGFTRSNLLN